MDLPVNGYTCYRALLLEHGAPARFFSHPMYRQIGELIFSYPHEVSAYIVLRGTELLGHCYYDAVHDFCAGYTDKIWAPIARYFERLGGVLTTGRKLTALEHQDGRLVGARFAAADTSAIVSADGSVREVPVLAGSETRDTDFAAVISTLPGPCLCELNAGDRLWNDPFFGHIAKLTWVSSMSLQVWLDTAVPRPPPSVVAGLDLPLSYAIDYKRIIPEFAGDSRYGAALEWVGIEEGAEGTPDVAVVQQARRSLARVPGFEGTDVSPVAHSVLRRNRANHQRYLLTDPGTLRFRPTVKTPLGRLYLAGDWVRNEIDIPTMEGAIRCGKRAAEQVIADLT
jgi:hypothetical protein